LKEFEKVVSFSVRLESDGLDGAKAAGGAEGPNGGSKGSFSPTSAKAK
jgi:hypothetical protein